MIEIYTDGSCSGNGEAENYGGYGVVITKNDEPVKAISKPLYNTTNNRAELKAVILAIRMAKTIRAGGYPREIDIYTDSSYVQMMSTRWMYNWERNGWKKGDGKTPENLDLVQELYELLQFERAINVKKIKGHAGHRFNEMADSLAKEGAENARENNGNQI